MTDRILITNHLFDDTTIEERVLEPLDVDVVTESIDTRAELVDAGADAAAIVNPPYSFTFDCYDELPALEVVAVMGVGVDHIDLTGATSNDVHVVNVPDYCVEEVSTHALSLLLAATRRLPVYDRRMERNDWTWRVDPPISRLAGSTLGLVGFGRIARRLAEKTAGFDLDLLTYDPYVDPEILQGYDVEQTTFEDLLHRADLVSIHAPATSETTHLFDVEAFELLQDGAILVNTSRGSIVDETALRSALEEDTVAIAGLDVFEQEPTAPDNPLLDRDDVIVTPHVGWYSTEAAVELRERTAREVRRVLTGEQPEHPVAGPAVDS